MTRVLKLPLAAQELQISADTLRRFIKGRKADAHNKESEPLLQEGVHWIRRGEGQNSPYLIRIEPTKELLASFGYYDPEAK